MKLYLLMKQDVKYQIKYGFYLVYFIITIIYIGILNVLPDALVKPSLTLIVFSDPAALGFFFIGGIVLLEHDERIQHYNAILPISHHAYILSKVLSLSLISTIVAMSITFFVLYSNTNYLLLGLSTFLGTMVFTLMGLPIAFSSKTLNQYFIKGLPVGILLMAPAVLVVFNITHLAVELLPATLLIRLLASAMSRIDGNLVILRMIGLMVWISSVYLISYNHYKKYLSQGEA